MIMTQTFKAWLRALVAISAFACISVRWFDRPIAELFRGISERQAVPIELANRILVIPSIAAILFVICGVAAIAGRRLSKIETTIALCTIGVLVTTVIKDQLKFVFGRTWPYLLNEDIYGFNFFQPGKSFESFPSGHAAIAAVVLSIIWMQFPTKRILCALGIVAVDLGLVVLNLHFLSDVVAGSFVGISAGLFTVTLLRTASNLTLHGQASQRL
jgi:membrane-associated phospholipid phosphatase